MGEAGRLEVGPILGSNSLHPEKKTGCSCGKIASITLTEPIYLSVDLSFFLNIWYALF